jgi:hypothetical protein
LNSWFLYDQYDRPAMKDVVQQNRRPLRDAITIAAKQRGAPCALDPNNQRQRFRRRFLHRDKVGDLPAQPVSGDVTCERSAGYRLLSGCSYRQEEGAETHRAHDRAKTLPVHCQNSSGENFEPNSLDLQGTPFIKGHNNSESATQKEKRESRLAHPA